MKRIFTAILMFMAFPHIGFGGGGAGGSTPPAISDLQEMLMATGDRNAGLFDLGNGEIGLGANRSLTPEIRVGKSFGRDLTLSASDFDLLSKNKKVDAISLEKFPTVDLEIQRSYIIEDGDKLGELVLKDRRQLIRNSVQ